MGELASQMLPIAAKDIAGIYAGDRLAASMGNPSEARDLIWSQMAIKYSPFSSQILGLRQSLLVARKMQHEYRADLTTAFAAGFVTVKDSNAFLLLTDILFARLTNNDLGAIDERINIVNEPIRMFAEMGLDIEKGFEPVQELTIQKVVEAVLEGKLRTTHQSASP